MRKPISSIKETAQALEEMVRKEKDARLKMRLKMLALLKIGRAGTRGQVADYLGVHRNTVGRRLRSYETGGIEELVQISSTSPINLFRLRHHDKPSHVFTYHVLTCRENSLKKIKIPSYLSAIELCRKCSLPYTRYFFTNGLDLLGVDPVIVSELLWHISMAMMVILYSHPVPEASERAAF